MKKVALETIGCRLNQYETEKIAAQLVQIGFERVDFSDQADLYIINTCTVTGRADASCRKAISRAVRRNNHSPLVIMGCYVSSAGRKAIDPGSVALIVGNNEKENIISILRQRFPDLFFGDYYDEKISLLKEFYKHHRAWVKIGDGCNQKCSFCIVPTVRGALANRSPDEIVSEISSLCSAGYCEIVLTGVHIGRYRSGHINSTAELLQFLLSKTDIPRLRLSSIEPQEVTPQLISVMHELRRQVCRHLHIPLQSGSDRILAMMNRPYTAGRYLEILQIAKEKIAGIVIGADVIVGFPGEEETDFLKTIDIVKSGLIDYLHVFSYSDRAGTEASKLPLKVQPNLIKERNKILRCLSAECYARALKREIGSMAYAISEHKAQSGDFCWGITDNYLKISMPMKGAASKDIVKMKVIKATLEYLTGEPI
ncbi:MAG: tRNA (N(6)-L-threonylcarbamoyladenosine(37)-C(2))-methylthiotransferase MtaB [candidate division Zixibacteria bacterium]|nr:tRNA (N(6)-L-threonylcarbamoyladenosine(37)-C(2))-methylthiotransferase MtaB [candidate division Zixibacteria bacterium]